MGTIIHHYTNIDVLALILKNRTPVQRQIIRDVKRNKELNFSYYDMNLSDGAFEHLVITMSPFCDNAQWAIVEALRDKYAPNAKIQRSNLAGKLAK